MKLINHVRAVGGGRFDFGSLQQTERCGALYKYLAKNSLASLGT